MGVLFCCATVNYADRTAISSVFPLLRREFGMSDVALAAIGSLFLWTYAAASPFAGSIADRFSRSRLITISLASWSLVTVLTSFAANAHQLLALRVLLGLAECLYLPASIALLADYHSTKTRATAMALHLTGLNFGMIVGGTAGGYLGQTFGWRPAFGIIGSCGILLAVACAFVVKDKRKKPENIAARPTAGWRDIVRILSVPTYVIVVAQAMLVAISTWMFSNWLPLYYTETFHMDLAKAGFSGTFMTQAPAFLGMLAGGRYSDVLARHQTQKRMLFQAVCLCVAAPPLLTFLGTPSYFFLSASVFLYSLAISVSMANEHPILCDVLPASLRGTAIGCMNTANCFAGGAGIMVAGVLRSHLRMGTIFGFAAALTLTAALLVLCGYRFFIRQDLTANAAETGRIFDPSPFLVSPPVPH